MNLFNQQHLHIEIQKALKSGKKPAFAYGRISSIVQVDGQSLEYQESHAAKYAEKNNLHIVHYYTIVESARKKGRKIFNQMIQDAQTNGIKDLIFKSSDRMSRNYFDLVEIEKLIDEEDFRIHFYQNGKFLDKKMTHNDRFVLGIEIAVAKQLTDKISHDVRESQLHKAKNGVKPLHPPFGYIFNKETKKHEIDEKHNNFLNFFFDEFDTGKYSIQEFTDMLNNKGYKSPGGKPWRKSIAHRLLTNEFYHGEFYYSGKLYTGNHEQFYDKERFEKRLKRLKYNASGVKILEHKFPFRKLLRCTECNKTLTGDIKKGKFIYYMHRCGNNKKADFIPEQEIINLIDHQINEIELTEDFADIMKNLFKESIEIQENNSAIHIPTISRRISELEVMQSKVLDLYALGDIDSNILKRKIDDYQNEINRLLDEKKRAMINKNEFITKTSEIIDRILKIPHTYRESDIQCKADLLRDIVEKINISNNNTAEIEWKPPYSIILEPDLLRLKSIVRTGSEMHA